MTRKDYELIAGAVGRTRQASTIGRRRRDPEEVLRLLATDLSASLAHDNPHFDPPRFLAACGLPA